VQNVWIQALADLGVVGLGLWAGVFAAGAWLAARTAIALGSTYALYALLAVAVLAGLWAGQSFVAGIPLDAFTWLAFGLAATRLRTEVA
jgi:O-antigen ligase